jgi:hypothetical protein
MADGRTILSCVVEGLLDEAVIRRLADNLGLSLGPIHVKNGKDQIRLHLRGYNNAARRAPWLVLVDLDRDECAPALQRLWLPEPAPYMCFRIAIRSVESWLLADWEKISEFLMIDPSLIPPLPEAESTPKRTLVELARRSQSSTIRRDLVPRPGSGRQVGPVYPSRMAEFVESHWRPEVAAHRSDSLRRCRERLRELVPPG